MFVRKLAVIVKVRLVQWLGFYVRKMKYDEESHMLMTKDKR
jgi:hypothetical protein